MARLRPGRGRPVRHEGIEGSRRSDIELVMEAVAQRRILPAGLDEVALREMRLDQDAMGALAERFDRDRPQGEIDAHVEGAVRKRRSGVLFQRMQSHLPQALPLDREPIVVPVREQLASAARRDIHRGAVGVDDDRLVEAQRSCRGPHHWLWQVAQAPQGRSQVGDRPLLRLVRPEAERDVGALQGPIADREERHQPLRARLEHVGPAVAGNLETIEQAEPDGSTNGGKGHVDDGGHLRSIAVAPLQRCCSRVDGASRPSSRAHGSARRDGVDRPV